MTFDYDYKKQVVYIKEKVDFKKIAEYYGVSFPGSGESEVQIKCPFHGADNKPSARYYPETKSMHCFYCKKSWDVISFVAEKENMSYSRAMNHIINRTGIKVLSKSYKSEMKIIDEERRVKELKASDVKWVRARIETLKGKIPFKNYNAIATAYQMLLFQEHEGKDISDGVKKLLSKINDNKERLKTKILST